MNSDLQPSCTLHNVPARYLWWAAVAVCVRALGEQQQVRQTVSVVNFWTSFLCQASEKLESQHSWGRSFWRLIWLTRTMLLKHLYFHFLFCFKCLSKRILLLGSWIPKTKHWICISVSKQSWPVSQYHQSHTLSTSAFQVLSHSSKIIRLFPCIKNAQINKTRKKCPCKRKREGQTYRHHTHLGLTTGLFIHYLPNDGFLNNTAKFHSKSKYSLGKECILSCSLKNSEAIFLIFIF